MSNNSLKKIAAKLQILWIENEEQDFGLIHGNAKDFEKFIEFFTINYKTFSNHEKFTVADLVFASANDKLIQQNLSPQETKQFQNFLKIIQNDTLLVSTLEYWSLLPDNEEFSIASVIKDLLK